MKPIFVDPVAWWVPFATVLMIIGGTWVTGLWNGEDMGTTTQLCVGLGIVLLILIGLHGRLFWRGQVARLTGDGRRYEVATTAWVGRGHRMQFDKPDATDWAATPASMRKPSDPPKLGTVYFSAQGHRLEMSFANPKLIDLDALIAMNPAYFAKVMADYPALAGKAG